MAVPLPLAMAMARGMRRCLAVSREQTLKTLASRSTTLVAAAGPDPGPLGPAHVSQPDTIFDPELWERTVRAELEPVVQATVADSASRTAVGYAFDVTDPRMGRAVEAHVDAIASWGESFRTTVADTVKTGMDQGMSNPAIASALQDRGPLSDARAMAIARTETTGAANAGTIEGWRQQVDASGQSIAPLKTWLATSDERTRESHAEADGQEVGIDEPFTVGGEECQYPGDPDLPPGERVNCRCTMLSGTGEEISAEDAEEMDPADMAEILDGEEEGGLAGEPAVADDLLAEVGDEALLEEGAAAAEDGLAPVEESGPLGELASSMYDTATAVGPVGRSVDDALSAIDSLHGYGDQSLPSPLTIKSTAKSKYRGGAASFRGRQAVKVTINRGEAEALTTAHELGHVADIALSPANLGGQYPSRAGMLMARNPQAAASMGVKVDSAEMKTLAEIFTRIMDGETFKELGHVSGAYGQYIRSAEEVWARAYAQWVATETGNEAMLGQVAAHVAERGTSAPRFGAGFGQWTEEEFQPIAQAITDHMKALGWMR